MGKLTKKDLKEIYRFKGFFPESIAVRVFPSKEGGFCADILTFKGCRTQADNFSELIMMVNDSVYTYFEIPEKFIPFMPEYMVSITAAQRFGIFPPPGRKLKLHSIKKSELIKEN